MLEILWQKFNPLTGNALKVLPELLISVNTYIQLIQAAYAGSSLSWFNISCFIKQYEMIS